MGQALGIMKCIWGENSTGKSSANMRVVHTSLMGVEGSEFL